MSVIAPIKPRGATRIALPTAPVAALNGTTVLAVPTYAVLPSGVKLITLAMNPTLMGLPPRLVRVLIGVTVPAIWFMTYTSRPSGAIAIEHGEWPTLIGLPGLLVAVLIGVTVPEPWLRT